MRTKQDNSRSSSTEITINLEYLKHFITATGQPDDTSNSLLEKLPSTDTSNLQNRLSIQIAADYLIWLSRELDCPSIGLVAGLNMHPSQWGDLGHLMICSSTIAEALKHAIENEDILNSAIETELEIYGEWAEHSVSMPALNDDELAKAFIERDFTALMQSAGFLLNKPPLEVVQIQSVSFRHLAPVDDDQLELYQQAFGCLPKFSAESNTLIYRSQILQSAIPSANPQLQAMLLQQIEQTRKENNISHSLSNRIQVLLIAQLQQEIPNQQETANVLGMSISTLKRRLKIEGTNYKKIVNQVRLLQAQKLLVNPDISLTEVSLQLGFSNASAFNNAFKKWTGMTPLTYRQTH